MMTLEDIIHADDEIFNIIEYDFPNAAVLLKVSGIQKSGKALTLFLSKSTFIKNGIYDLLESKNLYACKILFRSLIEHYLKLHYIAFKVAGSKTVFSVPSVSSILLNVASVFNASAKVTVYCFVSEPFSEVTSITT